MRRLRSLLWSVPYFCSKRYIHTYIYKDKVIIRKKAIIKFNLINKLPFLLCVKFNTKVDILNFSNIQHSIEMLRCNNFKENINNFHRESPYNFGRAVKHFGTPCQHKYSTCTQTQVTFFTHMKTARTTSHQKSNNISEYVAVEALRVISAIQLHISLHAKKKHVSKIFHSTEHFTNYKYILIISNKFEFNYRSFHYLRSRRKNFFK